MKMLKNILVLLLLGVLVLGLSSCGADNVDVDKNNVKVAANSNDVADDNSMLDKVKDNLPGFGASTKCTMKTDESGEKVELTLYLHGKDMKTIMYFDDPEGVETATMYSLIKDKKMYMWNENLEGGQILSLEGEDIPNNDYSSFVNGDYELYKNQIEDEGYKCSNWNYDSKEFELPNIEFQDMTEMMKGFEEQMKQACDQCNELTGDDKKSCQEMAC